MRAMADPPFDLFALGALLGEEGDVRDTATLAGSVAVSPAPTVSDKPLTEWSADEVLAFLQDVG